MKNCLSVIVLLVLLYALPLSAQKPVQDTIPTLKEWWRAPETEKGLGKYGVCYIPNFYHGRDAMGVSINNGQMETWLNRFPGDRENVFTWKGGGPVLQGDFNGDGITDFMAGGYVYRGIKNGEPPDSVPVRYKNFFTAQVIDVNHDGYDDIISIAGVGNTTIVQIFYGASDFNNMTLVNIDRNFPMDTSMTGEQVYMGEDGDMRFMMFTHKKLLNTQKQRNGYVLFRAKWQKGDTLPTFENLSSVLRYKDNELSFLPGGETYSSKHSSKKFFITREYFEDFTEKYNVVFYEVSNDKFEEKLRFRMDNAYTITPLSHSIDNDSIEDMMIRQGRTFFFYSGKDIPTDKPFSSFTTDCTKNPSIAYSIGDVSNDGVSDMVLSLGCVQFVEGLNNKTGISNGSSQPVFSLTDTSPFPLKNNTPSTMKVVIPKQGKYILEVSTLTGRRLGEIINQIFEAGEQKIVVNVSSLALGAGSYILNLHSESGNIVAQRIIIIE